MASFYSVDRRGLYQVGEMLPLTRPDHPRFPQLLELPGCFSADELRAHITETFPEGLSFHGLDYLCRRHDFVRLQTDGPPFVNHSLIIELVVEYVRQSSFLDRPSRFQSFFGWERLDAAQTFRVADQPIFRLECDRFHRSDMNLLTVGCQNAAGSYCAHKYWRGEGTDNPTWEVLLASPVRVAERAA